MQRPKEKRSKDKSGVKEIQKGIERKRQVGDDEEKER